MVSAVTDRTKRFFESCLKLHNGVLGGGLNKKEFVSDSNISIQSFISYKVVFFF